MPVLRKAYSQALDPKISDFITSISEDTELISADVNGSIAHCRMLEKTGLLSADQAANILKGLEQLANLAGKGEFSLSAEYEDVHMNVEKKLSELIGQDALRLHTARSRNDQVALDFRLYVMAVTEAICTSIRTLQKTLQEKSAEYPKTVMPGYTHLQRAQPVFFSHAMLAFDQMLERDLERFQQARSRAAISPLGAGAQAGTSLEIEPAIVAAHLDMTATFKNSIDAVTDRDFAADFAMAAALCSTHLSQLSETLIIWNTSEFGFIRFSDSCTTSSSLMPQKKNPDPVEIVRGKTGSTVGELVNLMMTLKGLPLGYNRDLQETKGPVIRAYKTLSMCLEVMNVAIRSMTIQAECMAKAASDPELMATDIVEYLVVKGLPFRHAHETVAQVVKHSRESGASLTELPLSTLQTYSNYFNEDYFGLFDPMQSASQKTSPGGTAHSDALIKSAKNIDS